MNTGMMLFGILWLATIVLFSIIKMAEHKLKQNEDYMNTFDKLQDLASVAVRWAQDRMGKDTGEERRRAAVSALMQYRDMLEMELSDEQIEMLVSAAYTIMIDEMQEPVNLIVEKE